MDYKDAHLKFVSNLTGTEPYEIVGVTNVGVGIVFIQQLLSFCISGTWASTVIGKIMLDVLVITLPMLLSLTLLANHLPVTVGVVFTTILTLLSYIVSLNISNICDNQWRQNILSEFDPKRTFITVFRCLVLLYTAISISAVDFPIFPRRFGKTENVGIGLMDTGVGLFIISNAIVSKEARTISASWKQALVHVKSGLMSSVVLLVLGSARVLATSSTDYHIHVTEYGVHWNFFITLAFAKTVGAIIIVPSQVRKNLMLVAPLLAIFYQICLLDFFKLGDLVADNRVDRTVSLLFANKEGIISCAGFITLYINGVLLGSCLFSWRLKTRLHWMITAGVLLVLGNVFVWISTSIFGGISRRQANVPYQLFTVGLSMILLATCLICDIIVSILRILMKLQPSGVCVVPPLFTAIAKNSLIYFLLANVMTGLIVKTLPTIYMTNVESFCILLVYCLLTSLSIAVLENFQLKFW